MLNWVIKSTERIVSVNNVRLAICLLLSFLSFMPTAFSQEVIIVPVRSYGQGSSEASAIKDAIVQAAGQITGERITASTSVSTRDAESANRPAEHSASIESKIDSLIRGVVKSSQTVSVDKDPATGLYRAVVDVKVASFKKSAQLNRIKLAIVAGNQPLPKSLSDAGPEFMQAVTNGLSDQLVASRKFAVLDRREQNAIQSEYAQIRKGKTGVEDFVRLQSASAADLLIVASIDSFSVSQSAIGSTRAKATVRAIILDYTSGQIRQAVTANGVKILKTDSLSPIGMQVGTNLAQQIIDTVFPVKVIGVEGNLFTVSAGESQFQKGDAVQIYRQGKALKDPDTGESLGFSETPFAKGIVEQTTARISVVKVSLAQINPADYQKQTWIVRKDNAAEDNRPGQLDQPKKKGVANDSDW